MRVDRPSSRLSWTGLFITALLGAWKAQAVEIDLDDDGRMKKMKSDSVLLLTIDSRFHKERRQTDRDQYDDLLHRHESGR
jgi:hypothetical protein